MGMVVVIYTPEEERQSDVTVKVKVTCSSCNEFIQEREREILGWC